MIGELDLVHVVLMFGVALLTVAQAATYGKYRHYRMRAQLAAAQKANLQFRYDELRSTISVEKELQARFARSWCPEAVSKAEGEAPDEDDPR